MTPLNASQAVNVAARLAAQAAARPSAVAIAEPYVRRGKVEYRQVTFAELHADVELLATALCELGAVPGMRLALLVRPSIDFIALVFALLRSGATSILIDPGMGPRNMIRCLGEAEPAGFIAIPAAQAVRTLLRKHFAAARLNVTVGRRWFWGGPTIAMLRRGAARPSILPCTAGDDPAAIIFTTGSTGPPKGVLYSHGNFDRQVSEIQTHYGIAPGEIDLPCFPLFGLFNAAMGVTTVIPQMDPTRPARVDPRKIITAVRRWHVTQSFGSPAVWNRVGAFCTLHNERLPSLGRVLSAGAPVPASVLASMQASIAAEGQVYTPYGATEALPVASISASEVLGETAAATRRGAGVCVGQRFPGIEWRVISAVVGPIPQIDDAVALPQGKIGELIVRGPVVTRCYVTRVEANSLAKIADGDRFWHRMGDVGYLDAQERFWFCGRLAHRVLTTDGPMYSVCCEAIFNQHPDVFRSALVGIGRPNEQQPVIIVQPQPGRRPRGAAARTRLVSELKELAAGNSLTRSIDQFLLHKNFPVDIRHNAKIFRERLAVWAARRLPTGRS